MTGGRFLVDQGNRETAAGVAGGGPGVVLLSPAGHVFGDPRVQRPVAAPQEIDEPVGAGPFRHPILSLRWVALSAFLRAGGFESTACFPVRQSAKPSRPVDTYGMETNKNFTDLLRLLADSHEHPDPEGSPLSNITDLGDQAVPLLIEALTHDDPLIRRTAAETLGQLRFPERQGSGSATSRPTPRSNDRNRPQPLGSAARW